MRNFQKKEKRKPKGYFIYRCPEWGVVKISVFRAYDEKEDLKEFGFAWDPEWKCWYVWVPAKQSGSVLGLLQAELGLVKIGEHTRGEEE